MKYAVMTTWKHTNAIDWDDMEASIGDDLPEGTTIQWFEIDEHNHGSFGTYASKEVYEAFKATIAALSKGTNRLTSNRNDYGSGWSNSCRCRKLNAMKN